jgi:hypothetical protein
VDLATSTTELTTSATDLILALQCAVIPIYLRKISTDARWRVRLWSWVFGLLGFAALLGAIAHGIQIRPSLRFLLWQPLNLSLGLVVALYVAGAFGDLCGRALAIRLVLWCLGVGSVFYGLTVLLDSGFIVFVVYEATAMAGVLVIYSYLTLTHQLKGAVFMVVAVIVNLAGAGVQASNVSLFVFVPFDHNGLFHLIQMVALAVLAVGLSIGMPSQTVEAAALVRSSCTLAQK